MSDKLKIELFVAEQHYSTISKWWERQKWPVVPLSHLSSTGIVISYDGKIAAAGWVYKTDSSVCLLEMIVADPDVKGEPRELVLSCLLDTAKLTAKSMGFNTIFMLTGNKSLMGRLETKEFIPFSHNSTNYACILGDKKNGLFW